MALSEKDLNENGWIYDSYYPAGDEFMYKSHRGLKLRVAKDFSYALTYCGHPQRQINSIAELEQYEKERK